MPSHERIGQALNSKNLTQDSTHFDADVVAALASAPELGASLQIFLSAGQSEEAPRVIRLLAQTLLRAGRRKRIGFGRDRAEIIARQSLYEWCIKLCRACNGTGYRLVSYHVGVEQPKREDECLHCDGTGHFMPTWEWRVDTMAISDQEPVRDWWEKRIDLAKEIIEDAFRVARRNVTRQLSD